MITKASVGTRQLENAAVTGAEVEDGSLTVQDLAAGTLTSGPGSFNGVATMASGSLPPAPTSSTRR